MKMWSAWRSVSAYSRLYLAEDAHAEAGAGEGVAVDHLGRQAEFDADPAHLVLEQFAQRLDQLEVHVIRQAADVVVRLDDLGLAGLGAGGFDHVRVDGALGQPFDVLDPAGLVVEDLDEGVADDLALLLRVGDAGEPAEKALLGVDPDDLHAHVTGEGAHHLIALAEPQQAVVDEDAGELVADGAVEQGGDHAGIDAAGESEQHLVGADLGADAGDAVFDDVARGPEPSAAADVVDEALDDALALAGVGDLGVELHAVEAALLVGDAGQRGVRGLGDDREAGRQALDPVAVAHPDVQQAVAFGAGVVLDIAQQLRMSARPHLGIAVFAMGRGDHRAAELRRPWSAGRSRCPAPGTPSSNTSGSARGVSASCTDCGSAGEDDAAGREVADRLARPCRRDGARSRPRPRARAGRSAGCTGTRSRG